jgi:hypothetical protein
MSDCCSQKGNVNYLGGGSAWVLQNFFLVRWAFLFFSRVGLCRLVGCLPDDWGRPAIAHNLIIDHVFFSC